MSSLTPKQFLKEVASHELHVLRDDGVYRHLRFQKPGTICMSFDLITWPGHLCYTGDMGTFVFQRVHDMLAFFRPPEGRAKEDPFRRIDRSYWHQKLEAIDRCDGAKEFDRDAFEREITVQRRRLLVRHGRGMDEHQRQALWDALGELKDKASDGEERAMTAAYDWHHIVWERGQATRCAQHIQLDTDEFPACKRWSHRFEWCCFALCWGVMVYDQAKLAAASQPSEGDGETGSAGQAGAIWAVAA